MQDEGIRHQMALMLLTSAPTLARVSSFFPPEFTAELRKCWSLLQRLDCIVLHCFCCCLTLWTFKLALHLVAESTVQHRVEHTLGSTLLFIFDPCLLQEVNKMGQKPIGIISHKKKLREWYQVLI